MGFGNYSRDAHEALLKGRSSQSREQVFKQRKTHALMDPKGVRARESRDSDGHSSSLPIVFALDVTGSMGEIPGRLAQQELPHFMQVLGSCGLVDPQVLFMAVGDATSDAAPLQVGQFETTAELMDQWLTWSYLEGNGGGQKHESYELALYFLAEHTVMDQVLKRKKRGYILMTGDELPYPAVSKNQVEAIIGDRLDHDVPVAEVVAAVQETFETFFLIPALDRRDGCEKAWRDLLGDHVLCMTEPADTCYVSAGAIALSEGAVKDLDDLAHRLEKEKIPGARIRSAVQVLTPYAMWLHRDGGAAPRIEHVTPDQKAPSFWKRLFK
ncbi:MAG: VWA domain-containing protein [Polyangiaceae bacterium]